VAVESSLSVAGGLNVTSTTRLNGNVVISALRALCCFVCVCVCVY
jgi:hypothetical protein